MLDTSSQERNTKRPSGEFATLNRNGLSLPTQFKKLPREEEYRLVEIYQRKNASDQERKEAAEKLVNSYLKFIVSAAKPKMRGKNVADVLQVAVVGFMKAVERFDTSKKFRLSTYSSPWITETLRSYDTRERHLIKLATTPKEKEILAWLKQAERETIQKYQGVPAWQHEEILAEKFGVSSDKIREMKERLAHQPSLNAKIIAIEGTETEFIDYVEDQGPIAEEIIAENDELKKRTTLLKNAFRNALTDRERDILTRRRLQDNPDTLEVIGNDYGITKERSRQIEVAAFRKVTAYIQEKAKQTGLTP